MNQKNKINGIWAMSLVKWISSCSIIFFGVLLLIFGIQEEGLRELIRWSARISFTLFCLAFSASSIQHLIKNSLTFWLRMNRKYLGISFAIIHLIHLVFLLALQAFFHPVFNLAAATSLFGGGVAYFFVVSMLLTSFDTFAQYLSATQWKVLHTIGGYWIWSIYMTSYYKRALTEPIHWIPAAILFSILVLRVFKFVSNRRMKAKASVILLFLIAFLFQMTPCEAQESPSTDKTIFIKNGLIIDGTGRPGYRGNLLLKNGKISTIETDAKSDLKADTIIDVQGSVVAPGFIDIHAHGDPLVTPEFENFLSMGVTTICLGMDGSSVRSEELEQWIKKVDDIRTGVHILPFIGHGTVRQESGIGNNIDVSQTQISSMTGLIKDAFEEGCWGVSMGLEYLPGYYAKADELNAIATTVGAYNGLITSHIRNEDDQDIDNALDEMIQLSTSCRINISHLKVVYGKGMERAQEILYRIQKGSANGFPVTADFYPYNASYTGIGIVFPEWAKNPKEYARVKIERGDELLDYLRNKVIQRNGPEATLFGTGPYKGKTLQDLIEEYNRPFEIILRDIIGPYGASAAYFVMDESLQKELVLDKNVVIGSDGSPTMHHPRGYGTFAKVLQEFVVQDSILSLENAIYKMSGFPAEILGLENRGIIKKDYQADLVIFRPEQIRNNATFEEPHLLASGIDMVIMDGQIVRDGTQLRKRHGRIIRKK